MNDCTEVRTSLGVYVLGAIESGERSQVEAHLEDCRSCRDELAGLAGMPALLGRVDEAQLDQMAGPPPELLDGLLARAAERRRGWLGPLGRRSGGRGQGWLPLAAAACVLVLAGGLFGVLLPRGGEERAAPSPTVTTTASVPPPSPEGKGERIAAENPETRIRGWVELHKQPWGTEVELYLTGVPKGARCRLLVIARDGQRDALGSWHVPMNEGYGEYHGSTMFPRGNLFSFEIVGLDGKPLLTIPA
ncbi:anti-sigma factor family protein [Actinomadura fibrosa]|uniref:Anti-sigma factor family protein n=1 Tax=Actinomadura fibrosa TaxID=111802 RepID=A0ABW2Y0B4_9ACTN|nr:zf-HC2 domain-containing protein [Actinomadura fibrosa]